jgi:exopolysaccharide biosynthesis protein
VKVEAATERVTVARLDPDRATVRVLYSPGEPHLVSEWAEQSGALLVVNGGYFTPEYRATGLTISDGKTYGVSYGDYAGMLAVSREGAVSVRWLRVSPYDPREPLREAIQCFPVLVKPGGVMGFPADADAGQTTRRTVVAQDSDGRILFLIAQDGHFSLHALAVWLAESDLGVDTALNLDGGPSSGLWLASGPNVDSIVPVPAVIVIAE